MTMFAVLGRVGAVLAAWANMREPNSDDPTADASNKTMLGVGLSSLLRPRQTEERNLREPSLLCVPAQNYQLPPPALPRWRKLVPMLIGIGAVGVSIGIGLVARYSLVTGSAPMPLASEKPVADKPRTAAIVTSIAGSAAAVPAPALPPSPPADLKPMSATDRQDHADSSERTVELGGGSCAVVVGANAVGDVWVDEQSVGLTPVVVSGLWCGRPTKVRIERTGFEPWSKTIITQEGRGSRILARLRRPLAVAAPPATVVGSPATAPSKQSVR
jgi:hypothetical protein